MVKAVFRRILVFLVAFNLVGAGSLPAAAFAQAAGSSMAMESAGGDATAATQDKSAQPNPCDSMPCHCMPGKGAMPDCAQMCLSLNMPLALENPGAAVAPQLPYAMVDWPVDIAPAGQCIKPDPFPPKRLVS